MAVILDEGAAAAGGLDDGFGTGLDGRPPGVDIAPGAVEAGVLGIQVVVHGAAATRFTGWLDADAQAVQHPRSGGIGVGRKPRLYAAFEHQHTAGVADGRAWTRRTNLARQLGLERFRQQRAEGIAGACQRLEKSSMGHHGAQPGTQHALAKGARYMVLDHRAADVQQVVVLHAGRAGGLAVAAGQAAVQVLQGAGTGFMAFEHLFHQVDAPTRAIQLVAEQLVGGAGGIAEAAVHAATQDGFGLFAARQGAGLFTQMGLHVRPQTSAYIRPGLKIPCGSSCALSWRW
ncbi:hypothetical protein D9M68_654460 [compost metagenome]